VLVRYYWCRVEALGVLGSTATMSGLQGQAATLGAPTIVAAAPSFDSSYLLVRRLNWLVFRDA
jgi:hypothetical protein